MCKKSARKPVRDFESEGPSHPPCDDVDDDGIMMLVDTNVNHDDDKDDDDCKRLNCSSSIGRQARPWLASRYRALW
jgi:hypothetical protein